MGEPGESSMSDIAIKRRRQLCVRMTDYENRRLEVLRRHQLPPGARPRPAGPCMVEAVLRVASQVEREQAGGTSSNAEKKATETK